MKVQKSWMHLCTLAGLRMLSSMKGRSWPSLFPSSWSHAKTGGVLTMGVKLGGPRAAFRFAAFASLAARSFRSLMRHDDAGEKRGRHENPNITRLRISQSRFGALAELVHWPN